jgi:hypothetical protein
MPHPDQQKLEECARELINFAASLETEGYSAATITDAILDCAIHGIVRLTSHEYCVQFLRTLADKIESGEIPGPDRLQ